MTKRNTLQLSVAIMTAVVAAPGTVRAAGFELLEQSAVAQGTAYAGAAARADDPSTMYYNPAGLTKLPGIQISIGASALFPKATLMSGTAATAPYLGGAPYSGTAGGNVAHSAVAPNFYVSAQVAPTLFLGFAVTAPFGLVTKYNSQAAPRYYALTTALQTINFGPTIAWRVLPQLSIGGGINIESAETHLANAVDFGAIGAVSGLGPYGFAPGNHDGSATLRGRDTALGWNVGLLYEPWTGTRVGLTYRSAVYHDFKGSVSYYNVPVPLAAAFKSGPASAKLPVPASTLLSVAQDFGDWTVLGGLIYTGWSIFHNQNAYANGALVSATPENFHDTLAVSVGADYRLNDKLTLRAGTMFDPTPIRNEFRNPRLPDSDRYWLSIGATYRPIPDLAVSVAYSHVFAPNNTIALSDAGPGTANFLRGNLNARYSLSMDVLSVEASYKF